MSRTYRRTTGERSWSYKNFQQETFYESELGSRYNINDFEFIKLSTWSYIYNQRYIGVYKKTAKAYKKGKALYHSDARSHNFHEPGPHWFINQYVERPQRRHAKRELQKYILKDGDYEVVLNGKDPKPYWT